VDTKFIIIRHGQSLGNEKRIYLGHTDLDLSELGKKQAEIAAEYFKDEDISAIYSSDLLRAYNTAVPHSVRHNIPIVKSEKLREINIGSWEGKKIEDIRASWPVEFDVGWSKIFGSFTAPNGEPVYEAGKRMYNELLSIAKSVEGKIIVTAHAAVIRAFWCYMLGVEPVLWAEYVPFPTNASASFVGFDGERLIADVYSFDDYLDDLKTSLNVV
jgi:broad specificity phosphatase PhoE